MWKSSLFKSKLQAFQIAIIKKDNFKSFGLKIISGKKIDIIYLQIDSLCLFI